MKETVLIMRTAMSRMRQRTAWLAVLMPLLYGTGIFAAVIGDQVDLKATHQAGVPFHQEPRPTNDFQRVPDGTRATVIEVVPDGRWLKLSLPVAVHRRDRLCPADTGRGGQGPWPELCVLQQRHPELECGCRRERAQCPGID